jgi:hypothetical protein
MGESNRPISHSTCMIDELEMWVALRSDGIGDCGSLNWLLIGTLWIDGYPLKSVLPPWTIADTNTAF